MDQHELLIIHSMFLGFRGGWSFFSQLINYIDWGTSVFESRKAVDVICLDFAIAFDKIVFGAILRKLKSLDITGQFPWYIQVL